MGLHLQGRRYLAIAEHLDRLTRPDQTLLDQALRGNLTLEVGESSDDFAIFQLCYTAGAVPVPGDPEYCTCFDVAPAGSPDDAIDASDFYSNPVDPDCRSWMNVPFTLADPELDGTFLEEAKQSGLVTLKGHRSVGGMRASIYNAMPEEGVRALVDFMAGFEKQHG